MINNNNNNILLLLLYYIYFLRDYFIIINYYYYLLASPLVLLFFFFIHRRIENDCETIIVYPPPLWNKASDECTIMVLYQVWISYLWVGVGSFTSVSVLSLLTIHFWCTRRLRSTEVNECNCGDMFFSTHDTPWPNNRTLTLWHEVLSHTRKTIRSRRAVVRVSTKSNQIV
jgi:hypothetical protein